MALGLAAVVVAVAAWVQAGVAIGYAMIAAPLLVLTHPSFGADTVLVSLLGLAGAMAWTGREALDRGSLPALLAGLAIGTGAAGLALPYLPENRDVILGWVVLFAAGATAAGLSLPSGRVSRAVLGGVAGIMGTVSGVHGPALAIAYARAPLPQARATIAVVFVLASLSALLSRAVMGAFDPFAATLGLGLAPVAFLGWALSRRLILPDRPARRIALALVTLCALTLILGLSKGP